MSLYRQEFPIKEMDFVHAGEASIQVKNVLKEIGADPEMIRRVAIASYEAEMNAVIYGKNGRMILELSEERVLILVQDEGPGIADIEQAMQEGFSTAPDEIREMGFGAGMGLPNIDKHADEFIIESADGQGTKLTMIFNSGWGVKDR